jgi:hypothetical protein
MTVLENHRNSIRKVRSNKIYRELKAQKDPDGGTALLTQIK